jgi:hypothetical protein
MKKLKDLSDNDLKELQNLMYRITNEIDTFKHVSDFIPNKIVLSIDKFKDKVNTECNKRENEF